MSEFGYIFIHKGFKGLPRNLLVDSNIYFPTENMYICLYFLCYILYHDQLRLFDTTVWLSILQVGVIFLRACTKISISVPAALEENGCSHVLQVEKLIWLHLRESFLCSWPLPCLH